jgi:hypothetical protein
VKQCDQQQQREDDGCFSARCRKDRDRYERRSGEAEDLRQWNRTITPP